MKRFVLFSACLSIAMMVSSSAWAGEGNGVPSGAHYNLNIIGVKNPKSVDFDGGSGHRIFVELGSKDETRSTSIYLLEGDFAVLDANGTDGRAVFQLPNPDPENDGVTAYSVYLRILGTPNGKVKIGTAATDPYDGSQVVSDRQVVMVRTGQSKTNKFSNMSEQLLYIYADVWNEATQSYEYMRVPLFSPLLQDYLWIYDSNGAKIVQFRFYEVPTTVSDPVPAP